MKIGKLYQINKYCWFLYPSKEIAITARRLQPGGGRRPADLDAALIADYWSKKLNCNISYISPNNIFCLLEKDGEVIKILSVNGEVVWIVYPENAWWRKDDINVIEEVNQ